MSPLEGETADEGTTASAEPSDAAKKRVVISVHRSSNALVLSGPGRELDRIVRLIDELSFNFIVGDAEFRIFHLQAADPVKTVEILEGLFNPRQSERPRQGEERGALPPPKISAVADPRARSVIVRAKPTDFVLIEEIVAQLDSLGTDARIEYRRYTLEHATPEVAQRMLEQLIEQLRAVQPGDQITVLADPRTRGLIVAARPALFSEIDDMVSRIDSPSDFASADVVLVPLKLASAASLAPVLQAMLRPADDGTVTPEARALQEQIRRLRIRDGNGDLVELDLRQPIKIMADSLSGAGGGNRIIVSSTPSNVIALEAVVKLFDTVPVAEGLSVRLVRLERANAETVSDVIEEIFEQSSELARSPAGQGEPANPSGRALVRPLHVAVDRRTNTLILSGEPATVALAI
ncbi:MAG TPA: secretin N-terminal domain-containing protein, partial [Planctomycetota bacterium]|nr:secretin N-terminal domain-containing protein [Planctomycetota bacterium]